MYSISQIIKDRFGIHRGVESPYALPNSLNAIRSAVYLEPLFVEFDVILDDGVIKTAHPPQEPLDNLEQILKIFNGAKTFPKIDLKLEEDTFHILIDKLIDLLKQEDRFILVNISGIKNRNRLLEAENYFSEKIKNLTYIRMNLDLARYRPPKQNIADDIKRHVKNLGNVIHSISLEINEESWKDVLKFGLDYGIKNFYFWLRGWPDVPYPKVGFKTILKAINLEKQFDVYIYFDININHIQKSKILKTAYRH
ncbi:MAG: hypothetical protein ACTSR8_09270 [Promethearchaeota archaeon]